MVSQRHYGSSQLALMLLIVSTDVNVGSSCFAAGSHVPETTIPSDRSLGRVVYYQRYSKVPFASDSLQEYAQSIFRKNFVSLSLTDRRDCTAQDNSFPNNNARFLLGNRIRNGAQDWQKRGLFPWKALDSFKRNKILQSQALKDSQTATTTVQTTGAKYNLVWSSGFLIKLAVFSCILLGAHEYIVSVMKSQNLVVDWKHIIQMLPANAILGIQVSLPLLASSCCLVQLVINLVAGGCAGFNTVLGPMRPFFVSLLLYITIVTNKTTSLRVLLLRWIVSLSPELVNVWNILFEAISNASKREHGQKTTTSATLISGGDGKLETHTSTENHDYEGYNSVTAKFRIPTMGCVACISKINSAIQSSDRVLQFSSKLVESVDEKGGEAVVNFLCQSNSDCDDIVSSLYESIDAAGFGKDVTVEFLDSPGSESYQNR